MVPPVIPNCANQYVQFSLDKCRSSFEYSVQENPAASMDRVSKSIAFQIRSLLSNHTSVETNKGIIDSIESMKFLSTSNTCLERVTWNMVPGSILIMHINACKVVLLSISSYKNYIC